MTLDKPPSMVYAGGMMTKQQYEDMAKMFGDVLAGVPSGSDPADTIAKVATKRGIRQTIGAFLAVACADDPNLNPDLFWDAVEAHAAGHSITGIQIKGRA